MRTVVRREWDRLIIHALFIVFGVRSIFHPLRTLTDVVPGWITLLLSSEFIMAGVMLLYGSLWMRRSVQRAGYVVAFFSLFTVTTVVGIQASSTISWLLLAFAMEGVVGIRRLKERSVSQTLEDIKTTIGEIEEKRRKR